MNTYERAKDIIRRTYKALGKQEVKCVIKTAATDQKISIKKEGIETEK